LGSLKVIFPYVRKIENEENHFKLFKKIREKENEADQFPIYLREGFKKVIDEANQKLKQRNPGYKNSPILNGKISTFLMLPIR